MSQLKLHMIEQVMKFGMFVATPGTQVDGHKFIDSAIDKGAVAILCENLPENLSTEVAYIVVKMHQMHWELWHLTFSTILRVSSNWLE